MSILVLQRRHILLLILTLMLPCRADRIAKLTNHLSIRVQERAEA